MIISIGGTPGSGKSTVGRIIAEKLGMKRYYIGQILRDMAKKKGMSITEFLKTGEDNPDVDRKVDDYQKKLGKTKDNFVIEGRTSFLMIPKSVKVFLKTSLDIGAKRIFNDLKDNADKRNEGEIRTLEDAKEELRKRMSTDKKRYMKYYNIDVFNSENYDLVIDTSDISAEEAADSIIGFIRK